MSGKTVRKSNIELLRALLMFMVIVLHYNNEQMGGGFGYATGISLAFLQLAETLCICAVNCFVLISAYFLSRTSKRSLRKPISLLCMVIGYQLLSYILQVALAEGVVFQIRALLSCFIPANWFVILFCVLYMISPYINPLFEALDKKQLEHCILLCLVFFVIYPTLLENGLSILGGTTDRFGLGTVTASGSGAGYTIVNFVVLYLIGGYLHKYPVKYKSLSCVLGFLLATACDFGLARLGGSYTAYSNFFVVFQAVALFLAFLHWDFKYIPAINFVSKSAFGIYLLHTSSFMIVNFWGYFKIPQYCTQGVGTVAIHLLLSCAAMYLACLAVDIVRRLVTAPVNRRFS